MRFFVTACLLANGIVADIRTSIANFQCANNCCAGHEDLCATDVVVSYSELNPCRDVVSSNCRMTGQGLITRGNLTNLACVDPDIPGVFAFLYPDMDLDLAVPNNFLFNGLQVSSGCADEWRIYADANADPDNDAADCVVQDPDQPGTSLIANESLPFTPPLVGGQFNVSVNMETTEHAWNMGYPGQVVRGSNKEGESCTITFSGPPESLETRTFILFQVTGRVTPVATEGASARVNGALIAALFIAAGVVHSS